MAVTPMKLVTIVGPLAEFDNLILKCVINKDFHPEHASAVTRRIKLLYPFEIKNPYSELLRQVEAASEHLGIDLDFADYSEVKKDPDEISGYINSVNRSYTLLQEERNSLTKTINESVQIQSQLNHLRDVNVELSEFFKVKYVKFRFGHLPRDAFDNFLPLISERDDVFFFPTSIEKHVVFGMYMTTRVSEEKVDALFSSVQFVRSRISDRVRGTGEQAIQHIRDEAEQARQRLKEVDAQLEKLSKAEQKTLLANYSYLRMVNDSYNIRKYAAHTQESFYLLGWVPAEQFVEFSNNISKNSTVSVVGSDEPEKIEDFSPPVKLKNNPLFRAFEPFVKMYGLPSYNEMDPTAIMAISYTLIFGMMFGDIGQGAVLGILGFLLFRFKKMWLGKAMCYFGVSSIGFGFVYGSIFGNEHLLPGFKVLDGNNSFDILQISINMSLVVLGFVMILNVINGIRQKNYEKIFFGSNSISGIVLYFALMGLALPVIGFGVETLPASVLAMIAVVPAILIFFREPLSKLMSRRADWKPHKAGEFVVENIFEMVEVLLSYVTNTISFLRVGAYAISHASMMMVVYMLSETADGGHNIIGIIFGNIVIMAIEGLLVGIQVLRLEFYEMFSRFYSGEGRPFKPVVIDYKKRND